MDHPVTAWRNRPINAAATGNGLSQEAYEGSFRRVFATAYTNADGDRLYADDDPNAMTIDNPRFKCDISPDRRTRVAIGTILIDDIHGRRVG